MSDLQSPDNINNTDNNTIEDPKKDSNLDNPKKLNTFVEVLIGLGITALVYVIILFFTFTAFTNLYIQKAIIPLVDLLVLACAVLICVKLFRASYKVAAIIMLVLLSPLVLGLLLLGACFLS